jgi:ATP-dependent protease ClpP protease subunit
LAFTLSYPFKNTTQSAHRRWYNIDAKVDEAVITIYDEIGSWGLSSKVFQQELAAVEAKRIVVHLNSPGGEVFDGVAIYRALKDHPAHVTVRIDSVAASIASVIAMAGDRVQMTKRSMMMIHEPYAMAAGTADDMRKAATALDKMGDTIGGIYADRAGGTAESWRAVMAEETWYSDEEAVAAGLADEVIADKAAKNSFDLSRFRNAPAPEEDINEDTPTAEPDSGADARLAAAAAALEVANAYSDAA